MWNEDVTVQNRFHSQNYIGGSYQLEHEGESWEFTGIYGFLEEHLKRNTWHLVQEINRELGENLVLFGDFNDIIQANEKVGGNSKIVLQLAWNRNALDQCSLQDIGFSGYPLTWSNGQQEEEIFSVDWIGCYAQTLSKLNFLSHRLLTYLDTGLITLCFVL